MGITVYIITLIISFEISFALYFFGFNFAIENFGAMFLISFLLVWGLNFSKQIIRYNNFSEKLKYFPSKRVIEKIEKKIKKSCDVVFKVKLSLDFIEFFENKGDNIPALKIIKSLENLSKTPSSFFMLSHKLKRKFYIKCIYQYVISNNLILAQEFLEKGRNLFKSKKIGIEELCEILRALSMLEYAKGNYQIAQNLSQQGITTTDDKKTGEEFELIKAKCMLKIGDVDKATDTLNYLMLKSSNSNVSRMAREILEQKIK